jgi:ribosomal protein S18 acetylase RimI-like enzyme
MTDEARVVIRPYAASDHASLMALALRLTEGVAPWRDPQAVSDAVTGWSTGYADLDGLDNSAVFVAEQSGRVVGFVSVSERAHFAGDVDGYIGELVVASDTERRGVGRALVAAAETWTRLRGHRRVTLDTGAANKSARAFYSALGYAEEDIRLSKSVWT